LGGTKGATSFLGFDPQQMHQMEAQSEEIAERSSKKGRTIVTNSRLDLHKIEIKA
jgi:hypothetical protein